MDEPGPYPSATSSDPRTEKLLDDSNTREKEEWERRILGPEKPFFIRSQDSPPEALTKEKHDAKEKKRSKEGRSERKKSKERKKCKHSHRKSRRSRSDLD